MDPLTLFHKRIQQQDPLIPNLREYLSENPNITLPMVLEDIQRNPSKKHHWKGNLLAERIPVKDILAHGFDLSGHTETISLFGRVDIDTVIKNLSFPWDWTGLTWNKHITMEDIAAHPELPWEYSKMIRNKNFKLHPIVFTYEQPVMFYILGTKITKEQLEQYPDKPWMATCLESPYLTDKKELIRLFHMFESRDSYGSSFSKLHISYNPNLNVDDLYNLFGTHPEFFHHASFNPNIKLDDFLKYPHEKWCMKSLSQILPIEFIIDHPTEYAWCWSSVMYYNKTITYDKVTDKLCSLLHTWHSKANHESRPLTDVTFKVYFKHSLLTNPYVSEFDKKRIFEDISGETYLFTQPFFLEPTFQEIRTYFAGKKIIRHIVECLTNPAYHQCRKRLKREHEKMNQVIDDVHA